ncbi:LamG-like jellyroll fold domain-containing protein [Candidatus Sumerlaeota bacterium]
MYATRTRKISKSGQLGLVVLTLMLSGSLAFAQAWYETYDFASQGVVGYWPFDGNTLDVSGLAADGVPSGTVSYVSGALNQGADVSGIKVVMGDVCQVGESFTVAAWALSDTPGGSQTLVCRNGASNWTDPYLIGYSGDASTPLTVGNNNLTPPMLDFSGQLAVGEWHHVALTWDGITRRLYIDGSPDSSDTPTGTIYQGSGKLGIGYDGRAGGEMNPWGGCVDELVILDRALSATEVAALAADADANDVADFWEEPAWYDSYDFASQGVVGYWPFDGNTLDVSGLAADGVPSGTVSYVSGALNQGADVSGIKVVMGDVCQVGESFTVAAWALSDTPGGSQTLVRRNGASNSTDPYLIGYAGDASTPLTVGNNSLTPPMLDFSGQLAVGEWHHVALTWDGITRRLYIDGIPDSSDTPTGTIYQGSGKLGIGYDGRAGGEMNPWDGCVDELVILDRALSATEVAALAADTDTNGVADFWEQRTQIIVFSTLSASTGEYEICTANSDGANVTTVTLSFAADTHRPIISPDGESIAFTTDMSGTPQIWITDIGGTTFTQVTDIVSPNGISPCDWMDNDTILYLHGPALGNNVLRVVNIDGSGDALLVGTPFLSQNGLGRARLSPDGSTIVLPAQPGSWAPSNDIYLVDADGTNGRMFYGEATDDYSDQLPVWDVDGSAVFWMHDTEPDKVGLHYFNIVRKAIDSPAAVTDYDEVVRPTSELMEVVIDAMTPDRQLLFHFEGQPGLYTWDVANTTQSMILADYVIESAHCGLLTSQWYETYDFAARGVVGYWPLDGNANDVSGNGLHGTPINVTPAAGKFGECYDFTGVVGPSGSRVLLPQHPNVAAYTLSMWVYVDQYLPWLYPDREACVLFNRHQGYASFYMSAANTHDPAVDGDLMFHQLRGSGVPINHAESSDPRLTSGAWHHLAGTMDENFTRLYLDGVLISENVSAGPLYWGDSYNGTHLGVNGSLSETLYRSALDGKIDEVAIFDRVLSAGEVALLAADADANGVADFWEPAWYESYDFASAGVVGYWPLDGNANDYSGNDYHGVVYGDAAPTAGALGQGYAFDGVGDYIEVAGPSAELDKPLSALTVGVWVKTDTLLDSGLVNKYSYPNEQQYFLRLLGSPEAGKAKFAISNDGNSNEGIVHSTSGVQDNSFHHVAGVYDGESVTIFIDGVEETSAPRSGVLNVGFAPLLFGAMQEDNLAGLRMLLSGVLDEVVIFDRALSAGEVALLASDNDANGVADFWEAGDAGVTWTEATDSAQWGARSRHRSVVYDGKMWVIGGWADASPYYNDVWHSVDGENWTSATLAAPWSARMGHSLVVYDNKMWVIGGFDGSDLNDVWYSSDGANWTSATLAAPWSVRVGHTSVVYDGKIWVMGGQGSPKQNDVWYSTDGANWTSATLAAPWEGRMGHSSVVHDGKMWVIGGGNTPPSLNDVWYSTDGANWTSATLAAPWSGRDEHTSVVYDGKIWVIGGLQNPPVLHQNDVWYSADGANWTSATLAASWSARDEHSSVVYGDKIWVMGGYDSSGPCNDVWYSPSQPPVSGNLVAQYSFNGNSNDASGFGNHGTEYGPVLINDRDDNPNSAYSFDGADYVAVPDSPSLRLAGAAHTFCAWVYPTQFTGDQNRRTILRKMEQTGSVGGYVFALTNDGHIEYGGKFAGQDWVSKVARYGALNLNEWSHVAAAYDGAFVKFYVNGVQVDSLTHTGDILADGTDMTIGRLSTSYAWEHFFGNLDDIRIYSRTLSSSEIAEISGFTNLAPNTPSNALPGGGATDVSLTPTLESSAFSDPNVGDTHAATHWQITATSGDYASPVYDTGPFAGNLTSVVVPGGNLAYSTTYYWHVRHQDNNANWSEWSSETQFATLVDPGGVDYAALGVIGYWPLDGDANDVSGNELHGTPINVTDATGRFGGCYDFTGVVGPSGSRVLLPQHPDVSAYTLSMWVYVDQYLPYNYPDRGGCVLFNRHQGYAAFYLAAANTHDPAVDGDLNFYQLRGSGVPTNHAESTDPKLPSGAWHHLAGTMDENFTRLYLDGVLISENVSAGPLYWGASYNGTHLGVEGSLSENLYRSALDGKIDEVAIFDRVLSAPEVAALAADGDSNGVADFWEGLGNQVPDIPSNVLPANSATSVSLTPTLTSSAFSDPDVGDSHAASQWQLRVAASPTDYSATVYDSEQTTTSLTSCLVPDGELNYLTTYLWHVRHQDNNGAWSGWSSEWSFTTPEDPSGGPNSAPNTPTNEEPPDGQGGVSVTPRLMASAFEDADAGDFQTASQWRMRISGSSYALGPYDSGEVAGGDTEHQVPGAVLAGGETYYWQARYRDSRDTWSEWSSDTPFTTNNTGSLATPEGLRAAAGAKSVWLTWMLHRNHSVKSYNIYRATSLAGPWHPAVASVQYQNEYLDGNLTPGTVYYYRLSAVAANGAESVMTAPVSAIVGATRIFMANVRGNPGDTVSQMLTIDNPNQVANDGLQIDVLYDETMLTPTAMNKTILTEGFSLSENLATANGHIIIAGTGSGVVIHGEGHVLELQYVVDGAVAAWDQSELSFDYVELVDNSVPAHALDIDFSSSATMTVAAPILLGDINGSGRVTIIDELDLRSIVLGRLIPTEYQQEAGDINGDHLLDSADVVLIRRIIMGYGLHRGSSGYSVGYPSVISRMRPTMAEAAALAYNLTWGAHTLEAGVLTVPLELDSLQDVAGMDIVINYDPALLAFSSATQGSAISDFESWQTFEENGQVRIVAANATPAVSASGQVAVLSFTVQQEGDIALILAKLKLSGPNGENLARTAVVNGGDWEGEQPANAKAWWILF